MSGKLHRKMNRKLSSLIMILAMVAQLAAPLVPVAKAMTVPWPSSWTTPSSCKSDASDKSPSEADIVGSDVSPAVGFAYDSSYFYFREKIDGDPGTVSNLKNTAWVVLFQTTAPNYQYLTSIDGDHNKVQLWENTTKSAAVDFNPVFHDTAELKVWEGNSTDYARVTPTGTDYYIDWAIPIGQMIAKGINPYTTKYFATSESSSNFNKDYLNCYESVSDLAITKTVSSNTAHPGDTLTYTLNVTNNGPENASGVTVTDVLPIGLTYVSSNPSGVYTSGTWTIGTLNNGSTTSLTINATVNSGVSGTISNTATVTSANPDSNTTNDGDTANTTIVIPANNPPVATDDTYSTNEDATLTIDAPGVLSNDTDADSGDSLNATKASEPAHGTVTLNSDGSLTYIPSADFNGSDSFTYKASDGKAFSNIATVTITVNPINDSPVALDDSYSTNEDTALNITVPGVLVNDTDVDGNTLTAVKVSDPSNGTLTLNSDGSFTYTPNANYNGSDSFIYKANDGTTNGNVATVTITVSNTNDAPIANPDSYAATEDTTLTVVVPGVLANDYDVDSDTLTAVLGSGPAHGTLVLNPDGSFDYTPAANYNGTDSFTYKVYDSMAYSSEVMVTITIAPINDAPVAYPNSISTAEDTAVLGGVTGSDADGDTLTFSKMTTPEHGTVALNSDGTFVYTPDVNYNGSDSFTFKTNDGTEDSNTATVSITVNPVNDAPVAVDDTYSISEDNFLIVSKTDGVLKNDSDLDSESLTAELVSNVSIGSLVFYTNGSFTYIPDTDFKGTDSFTYLANDGVADSNVATVTINVGDVNDAPVAVDDSYGTNEDTVLTVAALGVLSNDTDADGDVLTAVKVSDPAHGTVALNSDGSFAYTPNANYFGPDSFTYKANDGTENENSDSNVATVMITVNSVNDAPTITLLGASPMTLDQGGTFTDPGATANDTEDGDLTSEIIVTGTVDTSVASTYYVNYSVQDNNDTEAHATRTVVVNPVTPPTPPPTPPSGGGSGGGSTAIVKPTIIITDEKVQSLDFGDVLVSWKTNIETTDQVVYGTASVSTLGTAPKYGYESMTSESGSMYFTHSVVISGLSYGIKYYFRPVADRAGSTGEVVGTELSLTPIQGEVKGEATATAPADCNYLNAYIKLGANNNPDEVRKLEAFLNQFEGENLPVDGIYSQADYEAVSRFQAKYESNVLNPWNLNGSTGYVYITTRKKVNEVYCQREFTLTAEQQAEIAKYRGATISSAQGGAGTSGNTGATGGTGSSVEGTPAENASGENPNGNSENPTTTEGEVKGAESSSEENKNSEGANENKNSEDTVGSETASNSSTNSFIAIIILLALGAGYYFYSKKKD